MNCGDGIRVVHPLFQEEGGGANPTSPLQLHIGQITVSKAIELNQLWHSRFPLIDASNVIRNRRSICFGAEIDGLFYASAIWSDPIAANRLKDGDLLLELRRMAIADDAPKFTATRMLKVMRLLIGKKFPELVALVSYQDTEAHDGTIYKAAGWKQDNVAAFVDWTTSKRKRTQAQSAAAKVRWRFDLRQRGIA